MTFSFLFRECLKNPLSLRMIFAREKMMREHRMFQEFPPSRKLVQREFNGSVVLDLDREEK
jgi:hypothetical protein